MNATLKLLAGALACICAGAAFAEVNWNWQATGPALVSPIQAVYFRATVFNDASSTEPLVMQSMFAAAGVDSPLLQGSFNNAYPHFGLGHDELPPYADFRNQIDAITLAPGESASFDFAWFAPAANTVVPVGLYETRIELDLCLDGPSCSIRQDKALDISWSVSSVPEPVTGVLFVAGLLVLAATRRQK